MKNIDADYERKVSKNVENSAINFDPQNPEGKYSLNLEESYNQICLQNLLLAAEKSVAENPGAFEIKSCFFQVTFNGKSKWDPPTERDA
jgi:hypothetical protein